jgi:outer membrane protein OmpA-like peptidoglycan-associated protein
LKKQEFRMQKGRPILVVCVALALVFGLNSCAWLSNTMSHAKERIVAMRERMKSRKPAEAPAVPAQVADAAAGGGTALGSGHSSHVIAGTGKPISNGVGECVNVGHATGSGHAGDCGVPGNVAQSAPAPLPAPVIEAAPMVEPPAPQAEQAPATAMPVEPAPAQAAVAQPSEELFPPATESMPAPSAAAAQPALPAQPSVSEPSSATAQAAQTASPAVTAAAPPAPPVVEQPMPEPPVPVEKTSLSTDALFVFGKYSEASILPGGKAKLKELAEHIKQMGPGALSGIAITGYADRIGRVDRNQRLSERRAKTVKNYLAKLGVDPMLMSVSGKGESDPVVSCPGKRRSAKLIKCLAPNRRVEVAFFGDHEKMANRR